ncbi:MAG: hypothetical protein M0R06_03665 [Sphaerochaeta sp.]|nr:hypothetical protein [Sphaerochaeta sp.]
MRRTKTDNTRRYTRIDNTRLILALVFVALGFAFLLGISAGGLTPERQALALEEAAAVQPWKIASRVTWYAVWGIGAKVGAAVMAGYVVFYVIAIGRNWLDLRARQIHAKEGLFPVIELTPGALYDPNRDNAGAHPLITIAALDVQKTAALKADKILVRQTDRPAIRQGDAQALEAEAVNLPDLVRLADVARHPRLDALALGVGADGLITASLHELMHVLAVGASGFGKSAFLRALMWQLAQVKEPVAVVGIDCFGSELNAVTEWDKLLYPVARDLPTAAATLQAVMTEIARRKALYAGAPQAYDLPSYNRLAGEPLAPLVVLVDEGTAMLNESGIADPLRQVVQTARQFGVYALLAGQNVNHKVMPTQIRDNFSTRLCFHTSMASRHVVLGETPDDVTTKGRAWVMRPGAQLEQIQCPFVTREEVARVITRGRPARVLDIEAVKVAESEADDETAQRVIALKADGLSDTAIAREVFKYGNPHYIGKVRDILQQQQQTQAF